MDSAIVSNDAFFDTFSELKSLGAIQFGSHISASQYLLAYRLLLKYAQSGASVLDWGTGQGHFSFFLLEQGFKTTGFSVSDQCLLSDHLTNRFGKQYQLVTDPEAVSKLCFADHQFDVVTSIGVLEHVRETGGEELSSLKEIKRILKPNGIFLCYHFPNQYSWIEAITQNIEGKHHHRYKYTHKDIQRLVQQSGLELVEIGRYALLPRLIFRSMPDTTFAVKLFNRVDGMLSRLLSPICQNYFFVARKIG